MTLTVQQRRVMRSTREGNYVNTINVADRVTIDFVWYPGAANLADSLIDTLVVAPNTSGQYRGVDYTWARSGQASVSRTMLSGTITLPLPPGARGTLTVFDTSWEISRVGAGVTMTAATNLRGIQERLNRLGYHLRRPGQRGSGVDGALGAATENAILDFQVDYRPAAGAAGAAANRLQVRGEWTNNPNIQNNLNFYVDPSGATVAANPSAADGATLQASLVAAVGA